MPDSPKCIACGNNHDSTVTCDSWSTFLSAIRNDPAFQAAPPSLAFNKFSYFEIAVTVGTSIRGWNFKPHEFAEGTGRLIRSKDGVSILASTDNRLWEKQIHDFEFVEGEQWTPEQIAAMKPFLDLHHRLTINELPDTACFPGCACLRCVGVVKPGTQVAVPNQAVHLGADGTCYRHGQSETCAEGFRRLGLDRKTPWMAPPAAEILMTDEMLYKVRHGASRAVCALTDDQIREVYRAMRPLEPTGFIARVEERADFHTMRMERDALAQSCAAAAETCCERDAEIATLRQALAMKDARIAQLDTRLASTPVAFEDPDAKPEPEINPFRNFGHDPRRMGPF